MTTPNTCSTCKYFVAPTKQGMEGECHVNPPLVGQQGSSVFPAWPPVTETDWCGQWAAVGV